MPAPKSRVSTDYYLYALLDRIVKNTTKCAIHPNIYTSIGAGLIPVLIYYMHRKDKYMVLFLMVLRYIFDCLDGLVARKCDLGTEFGKLFDEITDHVCLSTFTCLWLYQIYGNIQAVALFFILFWLSYLFGCPTLFHTDNGLMLTCVAWFFWYRSLKL